MEDGGIPWDRIPVQLYVAAAVIAVVAVLVAIVVGWVVWRRARRSPAWRAAKLHLQAELDPSPARRAVARLRAELDQALAATDRAVAEAAAGGWAVADLPSLARRLDRVAGSLQAELTVLGREPDNTVVERSLTEAEGRVQRALDIATDLRQAAMTSMRRATDDDLVTLSDDADLETRALRAALDDLATRQAAPLLSAPGEPDRDRVGGS